MNLSQKFHTKESELSEELLEVTEFSFLCGGCLTLGKCRQGHGYNNQEMGSVLPLRSYSEDLYIELSSSS